MITVVGGGSGLKTFAKIFKDLDKRANYIVSVFDDGLTTGKLRELENIPAIGDIRKVIEVLASNKLVDIFEEKLSGNFYHMKVGNIVLLSYIRKYGFLEGIRKVQEDLDVFGKVYPISEDNSYLVVKTTKEIIKKAEYRIEQGNYDGEIIDLWLEPRAKLNPEVKDVLLKSRYIIFSFGSFFGSILVNFLVEGFIDVLSKSRAKIYFFINIARDKETRNFESVRDYIEWIEKFTNRVDYFVANSKILIRENIKPYGNKNIIYYDLIDEKNPKKHDYNKLKNFIKEVIKNEI